MSDDRIDRYARRELAPAEARDLAQKSLDDPALFDELTGASLAQAGLSKRSVAGAKVVRFPRRTRVVAAGAAVAAAVTVVLLSTHPREVPETASAPILLASAASSQPGAGAFRGDQPDSRPPRPTGSIVAIEDGAPAIDLGSVDGLSKGSELEVFRDGRSAGRLQVTTVFRERSRCRILAGAGIREHSEVRVSDAGHLTGLLDQVDALYSRGDSDGTRKMAEEATQWARAANIAPADKQKALDRLAALESAALNNQAVELMRRADYDGAEPSLRRAISISPRTCAIYGRSANNLGALAEYRKDQRKAAVLYEDAQRALAAAADATAQDRQAVETNLARVRGAQ